MKGTYRDLMSVEEFFQALYQDRSFFAEHGITHIRSASLYFTPCDERGKPVTVRDVNGNTVEGYESAGCYHSAAEQYESAGGLEPKPVSRTTTTSRRGRGRRDARRCKPG
jgi:hypothetical protein